MRIFSWLSHPDRDWLAHIVLSLVFALGMWAALALIYFFTESAAVVILWGAVLVGPWYFYGREGRDAELKDQFSPWGLWSLKFWRWKDPDTRSDFFWPLGVCVAVGIAGTALILAA